MTRLSTPPEDRGIRATGESSDVMEAMLQEFALTTNAAERLDATVLIQSVSMKKMYDVLKRTMPLVTAFQKNNTAALANYHNKITEELISGWEQKVKAAVGISKGAASIRDGARDIEGTHDQRVDPECGRAVKIVSAFLNDGCTPIFAGGKRLFSDLLRSLGLPEQIGIRFCL
ncbi:MAG: hypothetical protein Q9202_003482 [Teloschistes flavicans]